MKKIIVKTIFMIFIIVSLMAILFLILYYVTPNNYVIYENENKDYTILKDLFYKISSNQTITINMQNTNNYNKYVMFDTEQDIIIKNILKSQNITYSPNTILEIKYNSDILLTNNTNTETEIKMSLLEDIKL